jgi:zinc D-Ala-D-Ala carboxypeptidase
MKLSTHFTLEEFAASDTASRLGIDNHVPPDLIAHACETADMMESIRALLSEQKGKDCPIQITSGYRCLALNRMIGSSDSSAHVKAYAVDFKCPAFGTPFEVAKFLSGRMKEAQIGQLIHEFGAWVHVSPLLPGKVVNRVITIDRDGTRVGVLA